jgi:hypothetical protein
MMCKSSQFGGNCAASFSCDGDAVFCAIALDQHIRNCTFFDTKTAESDLATQAAAGNDPLKATFPDPAHPTSVSMSSAIDQTALFSASCLPSVTTSIGGHAITVDTTWYCQYAAMMGNVFVVACLIGAALIIGKGA